MITEDTQNQNQAPETENQEAPNTENQQQTTETAQEQQAPSFSDDDILKVLSEKTGRTISSFEDLNQPPLEKEVIKEVDKYEGVFDSEDEEYFAFKKETKLGRKEFEFLKQDLEKVDPLVWAREKVKKESGQDLPDNIIDEFLEEELGITLEELDARGQIKLAQYGRDIKEAKKAEQEKYRQPINKQPASTQEQPQQPELLKLDDGRIMAKADYEAMVEKQQQYIKDAQEAGNRVTGSTFKITVDDNGETRELNYGYEFADEDRRSAVSDATDLNAVVTSYKTETGFNHEQFQEDMFWRNPKNREKAITSIVNKARAEAIAEVLKQRGNVNFDAHLPLQTSKDGVKMVSAQEAFKLR